MFIKRVRETNQVVLKMIIDLPLEQYNMNHEDFISKLFWLIFVYTWFFVLSFCSTQAIATLPTATTCKTPICFETLCWFRIPEKTPIGLFFIGLFSIGIFSVHRWFIIDLHLEPYNMDNNKRCNFITHQTVINFFKIVLFIGNRNTSWFQRPPPANEVPQIRAI